MFKAQHSEGPPLTQGRKRRHWTKTHQKESGPTGQRQKGENQHLLGTSKFQASSQLVVHPILKTQGAQGSCGWHDVHSSLLSPIGALPDLGKHGLCASFFRVSVCLSMINHHSRSSLWTTSEGRDWTSHSRVFPVGCWTVLAHVWQRAVVWLNFHTQDSRVKHWVCQTLPESTTYKPSLLAHKKCELRVIPDTALFWVFLIRFLNKIKLRPGALS